LEVPARTSVMELDVDALPPAPVAVGPRISAFPPVHMDMALIVGNEHAEAAVRAIVLEAAGELLEDLRLFDVYTGYPVPDGSRSLAYRLTFRAPDRTLTGEEASTAFYRAVDAAIGATGGTLRG
jgi:phenylalanyl-tRNA synthetase beta chain